MLARDAQRLGVKSRVETVAVGLLHGVICNRPSLTN
jgi:hypothetical protein